MEQHEDNNSISTQRRAQARRDMADKWAKNRQKTKTTTRRRNSTENSSNNSQQQPQDPSPPSLSSRETDDSAAVTAPHKNQNNPSFCFVLKQFWSDVVLSSSSGSNKVSPEQQNKTKSSIPSKIKPKPKMKKSFPSVLSILQTYEIQHQVESLMMEQQQEEAKEGEEKSQQSSQDTTNTSDHSNNNFFLSILPADYDMTQAIVDMCHEKSRAFVLVDLAAICQAHVLWRKKLSVSTTSSKKIQFMTAHHNADPKLLQVLQRLSVACQVSTTYDLEQVTKVVVQASSNTNTNASSKTIQILDSPPSTSTTSTTTTTTKPNSYYRKLVLDHGVTELVVDGPEEMQRLDALLRRMARRRQTLLPELSFVLHLTTSSNMNIKELIQQSFATAQSLSHQLVGLSVRLPSISLSNNNKHDHLASILDPFCEWVEAGLETLGNLMNKNNHTTDKPCLILTDNPDSDTKVISFLHDQRHWFARLLLDDTNLTSRLALDVSALLLDHNATALCTRIIGTKCQQKQPPQSDKDDTTATGTINVQYYIDDGCYGSLYQYGDSSSSSSAQDGDEEHGSSSTPEVAGQRQPQRLTIMPLMTHRNRRQSQQEQSQQLVKATIWGPTCDGLDKVCQDIEYLPLLERDDWLVFPTSTTRYHVGTSFNGFAPPDMVYCVLGYRGSAGAAAGARSSSSVNLWNHNNRSKNSNNK